MYTTLVANINEIWIKGKNRRFFFQELAYNIKAIMHELHPYPYTYKTDGAKYILSSDHPFSQELTHVLIRTPGIQTIDLVREIPLDFSAILPAVIEEMKSFSPPPKTFKIETSRSEKKFPLKSLEVNKQISAQVFKYFPDIKAKMDDPDLKVMIRILSTGIYISSKKLKGVGGLPVGTAGKMICLLSGGLDSPVASYMLSRRGAEQVFAFFHSYPFVGHEVKDKIFELSKIISLYQRNSPLVIIPFGNIQKKIAESCRQPYRTLFYRVFMVKCSEMLAHMIKAQALITGDSLAQVSSQTLGNLIVLDKAVNMPIFRPLIGFNKLDIIKLAEEIGTFNTSVIPHDDACALLAPEHPITSPKSDYWVRFLKNFNIDSEMKAAIESAEVYTFGKNGSMTRVNFCDVFPPLKSI